MNASVFIPLIEIDNEVHVLYQVRSEHIRQGGEIGFPGGMVEKVDQGNYEKTAIRETVEELGVEEEDIDVIGYMGTLVNSSNVTLDVYIGTLTYDAYTRMNFSDEVASVFTVPLKWLISNDPEIHYIRMEVKPTFVDEDGDEVILLDAKSLGLPKRYEKPWDIGRRKVYFYRFQDKLIWGMTGEITYEFLKLLS